MIKVLGFPLYGALAASNRYRLGQYVDMFSAQGIELHLTALLNDDYLRRKFSGKSPSIINLLRSVGSRIVDLQRQHKYDLIILHCELLPLLPGLLECGLLRVPYIYDFDDAFYLKYRSGCLGLLKSFLSHKFDSVIKSAAAVAAGNLELVRYAKIHNSNTHYMPTVVNTDRYTPATNKVDGEYLTIGWIGSPSTSKYLQTIAPALSEICIYKAAMMRVIGSGPIVLSGVPVDLLPWNEETEVADIQAFDVGIMPLPDEPWTRGKCGFKLIQYMACGLPVVASPVGANLDIVEHGVNGFLADTRDEWIHALTTLQNDPELRRRMGEAGRRKVETHYSLQVTAPRYGELIRNVLSGAY